MLIGDLWRWSLHREYGAPDDLAKAWRQTIRWLVADVPRRIETSVESDQAGSSEAVIIRVRVRDKDYQPQDNAAVAIQVTPPQEEPQDPDEEKKTITLSATASLDEPGVFEATYVPRDPGPYQAETMVFDENGELLSKTKTGWAVDPGAEEFREIIVNREAMEALAEATGGEVLTVEDLDQFVERLPTKEVPVQETWTTPLWHSPWVLLLILGCLAGEWGLRRWRGLA